MVLGINIGNTHIQMGVFREETIEATFRMTATIQRTSDEYGVLLCDMLKMNQIEVSDIGSVIIACVVPQMIYSVTNGIIKYLHQKPLIVNPGIKSGIRLNTENPKEIGANRIAAAVAAYELYGGPVIVVNFDTATTYDLVLEDGSFTAGVTAPGIKISANALWNCTAKLPEVEIEKPRSILAKNTIASIQAGIVYGQIGQTEYIIKKMTEETGLKNVKVVVTGGLGKMIAESSDIFQIYDAHLILKGLRSIWSKNANRKC